MTHVKICGFQHAKDALVAAEAGTEAIGLVFVPSARRRLTVEQAEQILAEFKSHWGERPMPRWFGLFADQPVGEVNGIATRLGLDAVQLCGAEGIGYCQEMAVPLSKVIAVDSSLPQAVILPKLMTLLQRHSLAGHELVLDTFIQGAYGGTGQSFDWSLAAKLAQVFKFSLAGGLRPENVEEAVRLVRPWGVDTSSGVETDSKKDPAKLRAFVEAVHRADQAMAPKGLRALFHRGRR